MKKLFMFLTLVTLSVILISCQNEKKVDVVATMFPQYDIARKIAGDKLTVDLLINPGTEVHGYQPSSKQILTVKNSRLFLFTSYEIDTWLNNNVEKIIGLNTKAINLSTSYELSEHDHNLNNQQVLLSSSQNDEHDHDHDEMHYWTDPTIFLQLITAVKDAIIEIDSDNKDFYEENAHNYYHKIAELHERIDTFLTMKDHATIYFAGHNAMQAFASRYHLTITSISNTNKPDADLTLKQINDLVNEITTANAHYLFTEELKDPKIANRIKSVLANNGYELTLLELHGYHNITKDDFNKKVSYYDLLNRNFENIKKALGD